MKWARARGAGPGGGGAPASAAPRLAAASLAQSPGLGRRLPSLSPSCLSLSRSLLAPSRAHTCTHTAFSISLR